MGFYIECSSFSKQFLYTNTSNEFRVQLSPAIPLDGAYEVCLHSISTPHVYPIKEPVKIRTQIWKDTGKEIKKYEYQIPRGYYSNILELTEKVKVPNLTIALAPKFENKVMITYKGDGNLFFEDPLASMMGLSPKIGYSKGIHIGRDTIDLMRGIKPILFQTSLISPRVFRESRRPILKTIYDIGTYVEFSPQYFRVVDNPLDELEFKLTDTNNEEINFLHGNVEFTLHFQKCSRD